MKSVFEVIKKHYFVVGVPATAGLVAFLLTYFLSFDARTGVGYSPEQPIPYSHKLHAGDLKIDCKYCHSLVNRGRHAAIPSTDVCMKCHSLVMIDSPYIKKLKNYFDKGESIPWQRIHRVPDYAFFNHSVHVNKGFACTDCHGKIETMARVSQQKAFNMRACLSCHRNVKKDFPHLALAKTGPENCSSCHR